MATGAKDDPKAKTVDQSVREILVTIEENVRPEQVERLRLLASSMPGTLVAGKSTTEIYESIFDNMDEENSAVVVMVRLLNSARYAKRFVNKFEGCLKEKSSQPTPQMPTLYFFELLIQVADEIGDSTKRPTDPFVSLRNVIPRAELDVNRSAIKSCVQLFQELISKKAIRAKFPGASLHKLEEWLTASHQLRVASIVKDKIDGRFNIYDL